MTANLISTRSYLTAVFPILWIYRILGLLAFITQILLITPGLCQGSEIIIRLSGNIDYPGDLSVLSTTIELRKVCFLGIDAKGKIDKDFLRLISSEGTPEGNYEVVSPFPDEKWPVESFVKNGALRLKIITGPGLNILNSANKRGLAIHGRDFYPILNGIVKKKIMINFYNDLLFEELKNFWGPLRISNWDMGRLADSWIKMNRATPEWKAIVIKTKPQEIKRFCKPPITKRTTG